MIKSSIRNKIKEDILWLLLCKHCRYCRNLITKSEETCKDCSENLPIIEGEKCKLCGAEKSRCDCKKRKNRFDGITAPYYYEGKIAECIRMFKFDGREFYGKNLAKDMANCVLRDFKGIDFDLICYVPFTRQQQKRRKYNQSMILAKELSGLLNIPMESVLIKLFENQTQHTLNSINRTGNVFGVYDVCGNVKDKKVLLVDDIKTTGATLDSCTQILKIRGAQKVYCVTAALSGKKDEKTE